MLSGVKLLPLAVAAVLVKHPDRAGVLAECRRAASADTPAPTAQFALIFERLALHYPEGKLKGREEAMRKSDWLRLVGHLPADIMSAAADAYVASDARFFPTPGQFLAFARRPMVERRLLAQRARDTLALIEKETAHGEDC